MKLINRFFPILFLLCLSTMFYSCNKDSDTPTPTLNQVTASFAEETVNLVVGDKYTQTVTTNCPKATIEYKSSDESVATVDPLTGEVTPLAKGSTRITATVSAPEGSVDYTGSQKASYQVNVDYKVLGTVQIDFCSSFSPDLLELVTPIVSYIDKEDKHEVRLNKDICEYSKDEFTDGNEKFILENYRWAPSIVCNIYETIDFDETISIRFESNKKNIEDGRKYDLSASAGVGSVTNSFFYNGTSHTGTYTSFSIDIKVNIGDGETHDGDIYEGIAVQKYIDELVKTKQEFHVEVSKDGKIKVNGK